MVQELQKQATEGTEFTEKNTHSCASVGFAAMPLISSALSL
jgi:hypothetical protein